MPVWEQGGRRGRTCGFGLGLSGVALLAGGCASPGPPRAPSLQLPALVSDLAATRRAGEVELTFAVPARATDGLPYRGAAVRATVCRAVEGGSCVPLLSLSDVVLPVIPVAPVAPSPARPVRMGASGAQAGAVPPATLHDPLPPALTAGPVRLLTYRVELSNGNGRTAGFGEAAYAAAGAAPGPVAGLRAEGSRLGVVVRWQPEGGAGSDSDVVLRRELVGVVSGTNLEKSQRTERAPQRGSGQGPAQHKNESGVVWLSTAPMPDPLGEKPRVDARKGGAASGGPRSGVTATLDDSAAVGGTYRYAAERQRTAQLGGPMGSSMGSPMGGHTLVLHSGLSAPVEVALRAVYPPPAPTDLAGTVFPLATVDDPASAGPQGGGLAVDLIWTPAEDAGSAGYRTVGYNVYREVVGGGEAGAGSRRKLSPQPVREPAFHDVLPAEIVRAVGKVTLQYSVTAVDVNGMESTPVMTVLEVDGR